jgi:putative ABC transport system permease protein
MNLTKLALRSIRGNAFRSLVVGLCATLVAGLALATTLVVRGAETSLNLAINRLGADIIVVPQGTEPKVESALLMSTPSSVWMPDTVVGQVAHVPGVAVVSPQLYLSSLVNASCCSVSNMFLVAIDPATDFTIEPWIKEKTGAGLKLGQAVGGSYVFTPRGEEALKIYGYFVTLKANLVETGTGLDQSLFMTFDTARDIARISQTMAEKPLVIPDKSISAALVRVAPGFNAHDVAVNIYRDVPGVLPVEGLNMFQAYRQQMAGLLRTNMLILSITWALGVLLIGLVFSMAANERRKELGVLRALGATRAFVLRTLLVEAGILALAGGGVGAAITAVVIVLLRNLIIQTLGIPFLFPSILPLLAQIAGVLLLALISVTLAAVIPAWRISHQDPAAAMRE